MAGHRRYALGVPKWLGPWLIPVAMVVGVAIALAADSAGLEGGAIIWLLFSIVVVGLLVRWRLSYLKQNPPDPELTHKPFWRF